MKKETKIHIITNIYNIKSSNIVITLIDSFKKNIIVLGIQISKENTKIITSKLKHIKLNYKNINPVIHSHDSNDNIVLTKYYPEQRTELEQEINKATTKELRDKLKYSIVQSQVCLTVNNYSYVDILKTLIDDKLCSFPSGFEIVGKIAHLNIKEEFLDYKYLIGQLILDKNPSIRTVVNKTSKIDNVYRTYEMELLAGEDNYLVEHKEGGILFKFDLRNTYWCSRLQSERTRILSLIKKGQTLCDAFCGVGPLSLRAVKNGVNVLANDLNPDSYEYLNQNIKINKLNESKKKYGYIYTYNMDAREFIKICIDKTKNIVDEDLNNINIPSDIRIDHFYMNLPKDAIEFLDVFKGLFIGTKKEFYTKDNMPVIHVYGFSKTGDDIDPTLELKQRIAKAFGLDYEFFENECKKDILHIESVRDISNKKMVFCIDMKIPACVAYNK